MGRSEQGLLVLAGAGVPVCKGPGPGLEEERRVVSMALPLKARNDSLHFQIHT